jgi:hypothetical protein
MRVSIFFLLFILKLTVLTSAQSNSVQYPVIDSKDLNIFIRGYADTIQANHLTARTIDANSLTKGFELLCNDSSVKIQEYNLVFDSRSGTLYQKWAKGSKMLDDQKTIVPLEKIREATLITIDRIVIQYKGIYYRVKPQAYFAR